MTGGRAVRVLIAGGGSAGHVQPALAVADALVELAPDTSVICLGTAGGLEVTLVPDRGYELELIPEVKFRRKIEGDLVRIPTRLLATVRAARRVITSRQIDVVIGFGGYVALPGYLGARGRVPIVVHEANARAGIANRIGARFADIVVAAVPGSGLPGARVVGNPVRAALRSLDRAALRSEARKYFGLDPEAPTLLVTGGSLGAVKLNTAFSAAAGKLSDARIGVLHVHGKSKPVTLPDPLPGRPPYVAVPYVDRMDYAYAAADLVVARAGAMTVAEIGAVKVPVIYVPLAFGNGEQALNAKPQVDSGAALIIDEDDLAEAVTARIIPLMRDPAGLAAMSAAAGKNETGRAGEVIAHLALNLARRHTEHGGRHAR